MAPLSLKIVQDDGAVTRKVKLEPTLTVQQATAIVREKALLPADAKPHGLFLRSLDDQSGVWLEDERTLAYYLLRDGDRLDYMCKMRNLRLRMLDGAVKTLQVDQSKIVEDLLVSICAKLGITNPEEYGLCFDPEEVVADRKENTGTLTLKKKSTLHTRDIQFEELSKKLKTDDNVEWIDVHKALSETSLDSSRTLLLKRRLFYSDRKVDARDPVQLNLLYVQTRDNILTSIHPVTEEKAAEFAGIQCHIQFGDYSEEKHKPGLIENLSEYLPEQYCSAWGIEKKILKEFSKHVGLAPLEAKHLYTKTARSLPTYGVTFFLVKEVEKGKKKLIHRLLGISAEAILRLDERTKEIIQQWPLTHVKTYSAGKGNSFTLNFGDYATEDYSVKTRDAFRIRDILEGYIDLIRKRMLAAYNHTGTEHGTINDDNVASSQASVITVVTNNPMKLMEHSLVGPSQIIHAESGQPIAQGAQIITVQQLITSGLYHKKAQGVKREAPNTAELQRSTSSRLKTLNSKSVKVVTFLTDPTDTNIDEARKLVEDINKEMPHIREGIQQMEGEGLEEQRRKLQQQMDELEQLVKSLDENTSQEQLNPSEAEAAAMKIAETSTQMYLALDPASRRRSDFIKRSRASFIADERTELKLRQASYIAASGSIQQAIDQAHDILTQEYRGPALDSHRVRQLEQCALDKIAKINAAIAHHLLAHADPHNIDYATGVNSLNTINELLPELAKDTQALASVKEGQSRQELLDSVTSLGDCAKAACALKELDDKEKLRELVQNYTQASGKLMFILGHGAKPSGHIEKQVLELAYEADQHTCSLVGSAQQLSADVAARPAVQLFGDATKALDASSRLCRQAELTAPTIHEPHCQSALRAAAEELFTTVQQLGTTWAPLVQDKKDLGDKLQTDTLNIGHALDKLKPFYTNSDDAEMADVFPQESNLSSVLGNFQCNYMASQDLLNKPLKASASDAEVKVAEMRLAEKLAKLNAALAALSKAYADKEKPDNAAAESAISTINDLLPEIAKDARVVSAHRDEESRAAMMEQTRALYNALEVLRDGPHKFTEQEALALAEHSGKLVYTLGKRVNPDRENLVMQLTLDACKQASALLEGVKRLAEAEGGEAGAALDESGAALADKAGRLMHTAQVTGATLSAAPCRALLGAAADEMAAEGGRLASTWAPLALQPRHTAPVAALDLAWKRLRDQLDRLANAADMPDISDVEMLKAQPVMIPLDSFKKHYEAAIDEDNKPLPTSVSPADVKAAEDRLANSLARLNAALAALSKAYADKDNIDSAAADTAISTINELMPAIAKDTRIVKANRDEESRAAMTEQTRALYTALENIMGAPDKFTEQEALALAEHSGKLVYTLGKRVNPDRENLVMQLTLDACKQASALLEGVKRLAEAERGETGAVLDESGAALADKAGRLMHTAQVTGATLSAAPCRALLGAAADELAAEGGRLASTWAPLARQPRHTAPVAALDLAWKRLKDQLDRLANAADMPDMSDVEMQEPTTQAHKLKFTNTLGNFKNNHIAAMGEVNKPLPSNVSAADVKAAENRLANSLARLNAALAALSKAYADKNNVDYAAADSAISTINELMPEIAKDTRVVSANRDEETRAAMMEETRALYNALENITEGPDKFTEQEALALAEHSGKLVYTLGKRVNPDRENLVMQLTLDACKQASALLEGVKRLAEAEGGETGAVLDESGAALADKAGRLMHTAQVTGATLSAAPCRALLGAAADELAAEGGRLASTWAPLARQPRHTAPVAALDLAWKRLKDQLDRLANAADMPDMSDVEMQEPTTQAHKLKFTNTLGNFKNNHIAAMGEVNKPLPSNVSAADVKAAENRLANSLARLNAALAALSKAYADKNNVDYAAADSAISTINELMPEIAKVTRVVSANRDEETRAAMMEETRALYNALENITEGPDKFTEQEALALAEHSGKLVYTLGKRVNPDRENLVMQLTLDACKQASALLEGVKRLAEAEGGETGAALDESGAALADKAGRLMHTAQVTGATLSAVPCRALLGAAADELAAEGGRLASTWAPLAHRPRHSAPVAALDLAWKRLRDQLDRLANAADMPDIDSLKELQDASSGLPLEKKKLLFIKSMRGMKDKLEEAEKELDKPVMPAKGSDVEVVQRRLALSLGSLNAAVTSLHVATADSDNPDYVTAQQSVEIITELMPQIIKDSKTVSTMKGATSGEQTVSRARDLCRAAHTLCHSADNDQDFKKAVRECGAASNKLVFTISPKSARQLAVDIAGEAKQRVTLIDNEVGTVVGNVGGARGDNLRGKSVALTEAAEDMLQSAQVSDSPVPLLARTAVLSHAALSLSEELQQCDVMSVAQIQLAQLEGHLDRLRGVCVSTEGVTMDPEEQKKQRLQFMKSAQDARAKCADADKLMKKPATPARGADAEVQERLSRTLAQHTAAVATLVTALADRENPDYATAQQSMATVSDTLPHVIKGAKTIGLSRDERTRAAMMARLQHLWHATDGICAGADGKDTKVFGEAVSELTEAATALVHEVSPAVNLYREQQIKQLSKEACAHALKLQSEVDRLAKDVGGERGTKLGQGGRRVGDAARDMDVVAQLTATSVSAAPCREQLHIAVALVSLRLLPLRRDVTELSDVTPQHTRAQAVREQLQMLEGKLDGVRKACMMADDATPPVSKPAPPSKPGKPAVPKRAPPPFKSHIDVTSQFLDTLRCEESQGAVEVQSPLQTCSLTQSPQVSEEEVAARKRFQDICASAAKHIRQDIDKLQESKSSSCSGVVLGSSGMMQQQQQLTRQLARAAVQVAAAVAATYVDKVDYEAASTSVTTLARLMAQVAESGVQLSGNMQESAREPFIQDVTQVCDAAADICDSAPAGREKVNECAVQFGHRCGKLLSVVSHDCDPDLEKEIISRAKAIGDSASRLAADTAGVVTSSHGTAVCEAGTDCVTAAGKMLYTAKVTAAMITEPCCQEALLSSTEVLSSSLQTFRASWASIPRNSAVQTLDKEADVLQKLLEDLRSDVKDDALVKRREVERMVVENTPMRELTVKIIEGAKSYPESPDIPAVTKVEYAAYCDRLARALRDLDLACARYRKTPHNTKKRQELDNAIQKLQIELLQTRPSRGDKGNSNIVDLRDFIEEMSEEVKSLSKTAKESKVSSPHDTNILDDILANCATLETKGQQLMEFEDMDEIDLVGEECNKLISKIDAEIKQLEDARVKRQILKDFLPLVQACDMMRFATKSSVSATASAGLDATLDDIEDVETRLLGTIVQDSQGPTLRNQSANRSAAASAVCRELCSPAGVSRAALTAYVAATCNGTNDSNAVRHARRVCELVKAHAGGRAARALLWQHADSPDIANITQQILQEISSHSDSKAEVKDIGKLLVPSAPKILGDQSQQEETLQSLSSKLSTLCGELGSSQQLPPKIALQEYSKRGSVVVATAVELDAVARGTTADPRQSKQIDDAAKEMKLETYNVLKIVEEAANDPQNPYWSRKLPAAWDRLNDAINNLVLRSSRLPPVSLRCGGLARDMERRLKAAPRPSPLPYEHAVAALDQQKDNIYKLKSGDVMGQQQFLREVDELGAAVRKSTDVAENCAYFIAVSDSNKDIARTGAVDVAQITAAVEAAQDACLAVIGAPDLTQAIDGKEELHKRVQEFSWAMEKAQAQVKDEDTKQTLARTKDEVCDAADELDAGFKKQKPMGEITSLAVSLLSRVSGAHARVARCALVPAVAHMAPDTRARCDDVITHSQHLARHTLQLLQEVQSSPAAEHDTVSWNSFSSRKKVIDSFDALVKTVKVNGHRSGVLLTAPDEEDKEEEVSRSYVETQVELARRWLRGVGCRPEVKAVGQQAARNVIDLARQMSEEQSGAEREETRLLVSETEELLTHCTKAYDQERNSLLMDRLKALNKCISRGVVTRVLQHFMDADEPLERLQLLDHHHDIEGSKREFILERKIAELLAQLGRVTRTARLVAATRPPHTLEGELRAHTEQSELLAPMLVQAAQKRIDHPDDTEAVEKYKSVLAEYTEAIARMRELCDRAVDPMDFVQAAGDTMQRMRDDLSAADPQKCHQTSLVINRLADRVMVVGMSSAAVSRDPALAAEVAAACARVTQARPPPATRASRMPDWRETTAQVLRMTGAVESALGGENIFKTQPTAANQPIYSVARDLHECVREWSSRDNDIVAAARRMAVLMARLSEYMETEKKQALITTSKSIVSESQEVAELAKKLAHECTDVRIKTNLLQLVERIPTISGQLKMLITVKGSSLGQQGNFEDKEAMDMLVVNAQSLMMSIQEVVKAAAGASVKIMSQRGPQLRWVRKNYY